MSEGRRWILVLGIVAALVQMAVPPHVVIGHMLTRGSSASVVIVRRFPIWMEPAPTYSLTDREELENPGLVAGMSFSDRAVVSVPSLGIQLGATALVVGLLMLIGGGRRASDEKKCPTCAEMVKGEALKCRFCGHGFSAQEAVSEA